MKASNIVSVDHTHLVERADAVVAEMIELGAKFTVSKSGPNGEIRWHWQPSPELMRNVIRKFWSSVPDRGAPGFDAAMIEAIRRHELGDRA